jgi:hypothetical protein
MQIIVGRGPGPRVAKPLQCRCALVPMKGWLAETRRQASSGSGVRGGMAAKSNDRFSPRLTVPQQRL